MWLPPPQRADTGPFSVGYDVFDRFDLGMDGVGPGTIARSEQFWRTAGGKTVLERVQPYVGATHFERELTGLVERSGAKPKQLYQGIRVAITGTTVSPGIFDSIAALGRDETVARLGAARAIRSFRLDLISSESLSKIPIARSAG